MSKFYVYQYVREDRTPYYIGKGKGSRAYAPHPRQISESTTIDLRPKEVERIEIVRYFELESDALAYEKELIATLPNLHNISEGGDQPPNHTGRKRSEETLQKMKLAAKKREADKTPEKKAEIAEKIRRTTTGRKNPEHSRRMKGRPSPNRGRIPTEETRQKMRAARLGKSSGMKGRTVSEESIRKMLETKQNKKLEKNGSII